MSSSITSSSTNFRQPKTVFVSNLHPDVTADLLEEMFCNAGPVIQVTIPTDLNGASRQFAYVLFQHEESVGYALKLFSDIKLFGKLINLSEAYERGYRPIRVKPATFTEKAKEEEIYQISVLGSRVATKAATVKRKAPRCVVPLTTFSAPEPEQPMEIKKEEGEITSIAQSGGFNRDYFLAAEDSIQNYDNSVWEEHFKPQTSDPWNRQPQFESGWHNRIGNSPFFEAGSTASTNWSKASEWERQRYSFQNPYQDQYQFRQAELDSSSALVPNKAAEDWMRQLSDQHGSYDRYGFRTVDTPFHGSGSNLGEPTNFVHPSEPLQIHVSNHVASCEPQRSVFVRSSRKSRKRNRKR